MSDYKSSGLVNPPVYQIMRRTAKKPGLRDITNVQKNNHNQDQCKQIVSYAYEDENCNKNVQTSMHDDSQISSEPVIRTKRKPRTVFTRYQITRLDESFNNKQYLTTEERKILSLELNITVEQIKVWFQNHRSKLKRTAQANNAQRNALNHNQYYNQNYPINPNYTNMCHPTYYRPVSFSDPRFQNPQIYPMVAWNGTNATPFMSYNNNDPMSVAFSYPQYGYAPVYTSQPTNIISSQQNTTNQNPEDQNPQSTTPQNAAYLYQANTTTANSSAPTQPYVTYANTNYYFDGNYAYPYNQENQQ